MVAECLGHLALLAPAQVLPALQEQTGSTSWAMRTALVTAVKFMAVEQAHPIDGPLSAALPSFLPLLSDPDRSVRLLPNITTL